MLHVCKCTLALWLGLALLAVVAALKEPVGMCPLVEPPRLIDAKQFDSDRDHFCGELWIAFTTLGFARVHNHGIKGAVIDRAFEQTRHFFSLPQEWKDQTAMPLDFTAGYLDRDTSPLYSNNTNHREVYHFKHAYIKQHSHLLPDPNVLPQFERAIADLQLATQGLVRKFFDCIADGTGFSNTYFEQMVNSDDADDILSHTLLAHYFPINAADVRKGDAPEYRLQPHTDWSLLTFTFQEEDNGGEDVLCGTDQDDENEMVWIDIPAEKYVVTVNVGELLNRWMETIFRASEHRILTAKNPQDQPDRYSIAYFAYPHRTAVLSSVSNARIPVRTMEYLKRKQTVKSTHTVDDDLIREILAQPTPEKLAVPEEVGNDEDEATLATQQQQHDEL